MNRKIVMAFVVLAMFAIGINSGSAFYDLDGVDDGQTKIVTIKYEKTGNLVSRSPSYSFYVDSRLADILNYMNTDSEEIISVENKDGYTLVWAYVAYFDSATKVFSININSNQESYINNAILINPGLGDLIKIETVDAEIML